MKPNKLPAKPAQAGQFRIVAGKWRSRKFQFPAVQGLRPTPDRVRETLFNWLSADIAGKHCVDLFSGCGALGLEALSRGAAHCVFIDGASAACKAISAHLQVLQASQQAQVVCSQLPQAIAMLKGAFNLVFIDPPYADHQAISACIDALLARNLLADGALVYCENASEETLALLPAGFSLHRHKTAGAVQYALYHYQALSDS